MTDDVTRRRAESIAPYKALIRHVLELPPGSDAVDELATRLSPERASERPPASAPGIGRLRKALRALETNRAPDTALEQLEEDLRFLRLFEVGDPVMEHEGMRRLLRDVLEGGD